MSIIEFVSSVSDIVSTLLDYVWKVIDFIIHLPGYIIGFYDILNNFPSPFNLLLELLLTFSLLSVFVYLFKLLIGAFTAGVGGDN